MIAITCDKCHVVTKIEFNFCTESFKSAYYQRGFNDYVEDGKRFDICKNCNEKLKIIKGRWLKEGEG